MASRGDFVNTPHILNAARGNTGRIEGNGEETKDQIRRAARRLYATHGYFATTNRMIAAEVGVSSAALHHFFGRKRDLVLDVWRWTMDEEYARMYVAVDEQGTFIGKVHALFDTAYKATQRDPDASVFTSLMREEARLAPELAEIRNDTRAADLIRTMVEFGVKTGALDKELSGAARGAISAATYGARLLANDLSPARVQVTIDGCKRLFAGTLHRVG
jgi:AcrR family transcriptional regulator